MNRAWKKLFSRMTHEFNTIDISAKTFVRFFGIAALIALLYVLREVVTVLLFAVVLASAMEPMIRWFQSHRVPRILATVMIFLAVIGALSFAVYLLVPLVAEDLQGLTLTYPVFERQVLRELEGIGNIPFFDFIRENARNLISEPSGYLSRVSGGVISLTSNFFGGILSFVILVVVSFYLAAREKGIEDFIRLIVPLEHEAYALDLWQRSQKKMGAWLRAQLLLAALIGALIYFGLTMLQVKYAIVFAFLAAVLELVPVIGPVIAAAPATFVAFLQSPFLALMVILLFVVVQQLESHLIVPIVMRSAIGISPLVVVIALVVGANLAGIMGLLLAVPVASVVVELLHDFDARKRARSRS